MSEQISEYATLAPGDPAPWFRQASSNHPDYSFDAVAGRFIVLCFFGSAGDEVARTAITQTFARRKFFDDVRLAFFGVSVDPQDKTEARVRESLPGIRFFWDFDFKVSKLYGSAMKSGAGTRKLRRFWIVLDPTLRVLRLFPLDRHHELFEFLAQLPAVEAFAGVALQAPILFLPNVFEPELCRTLIEAHEHNGGEITGFMSEVDGKTVHKHDARHKVRKDYLVEDANLKALLQARIRRRVIPEISKVHQFAVTRMERYLIGCYAAEDAAHFSAHRDNTTAGTAHRRFAVSINLNSDFEGGEVSFPEYGPRSFKPPPGGAVVFSCSLLHAVSRVSKGRRYAFLPFLYDDAAAKLREANASKVAGGSPYRA